MSKKRTVDESAVNSPSKRIKVHVTVVEIEFKNNSPHILYEIIPIVLNCKLFTWKDIETLIQVSHSMRYYIKREFILRPLGPPLRNKGTFQFQHGYLELLWSNLITQYQFNLIIPKEKLRWQSWLKKVFQKNNWTRNETMTQDIEYFLSASKTIPDGIHLQQLMNFNTNMRLKILKEFSRFGFSLWKPIQWSLSKREDPKFIRKLLEVQRNSLPNTRAFSGHISYHGQRFNLDYINKIFDLFGPDELVKMVPVFKDCRFLFRSDGMLALLNKRVSILHLAISMRHYRLPQMNKINLSQRLKKLTTENLYAFMVQLFEAETLRDVYQLECFKTKRLVNLCIHMISVHSWSSFSDLLQYSSIRDVVLTIPMKTKILFMNVIPKEHYVEFLCIIWQHLMPKPRSKFLAQLENLDAVKVLKFVTNLQNTTK